MDLKVARPNMATNPGDVNPGTGTGIYIRPPLTANQIRANAGQNVTNVSYDRNNETLSFRFNNQVNWAANVYIYRYFTDPQGRSDLFVVQGLANAKTDYISFISDKDPGGDLNADPLTLVPKITGNNAAPSNQGDMSEGDWRLAFNTGPDQYYVRSDLERNGRLPEPSTLTMFGIGFAAMGAYRWLSRRRQHA
jgi:hypothetical protein